MKHNQKKEWICPDCWGRNGCMCALKPKKDKKKESLRKQIEEILRDKILFIGNEMPESFLTDKRDKQLYLGYPQQFIDQILTLIAKEMEKVIGKDIDWLETEESDPEEEEIRNNLKRERRTKLKELLG